MSDEMRDVPTKILYELCKEFIAYEDSDEYFGPCCESIVGDIAYATKGWHTYARAETKVRVEDCLKEEDE